jgi:hypothetical protein
MSDQPMDEMLEEAYFNAGIEPSRSPAVEKAIARVMGAAFDNLAGKADVLPAVGALIAAARAEERQDIQKLW